MEKRYVWYLCLVLWLPDDALMKVVLFGFVMPGRACLRCSQMTGRVIMLLDLAGLTQQGRIQTPGTGASLSSQASPGAFL
jgi:hypothetical protein